MVDAMRRCAAAAVLALLAGMQPTHAQQRYTLDQRYGSIGFSVGHLGLFSSQGQFRHFQAQLVLDPAHPERTRIDVQVQAGSATMAWPQATDMVRSDDFLDVKRYPQVWFRSSSVTRSSPDHYVIRGLIQLHGVSRPMVLMAHLTARRPDPQRHAEWADFIVTGSLERSDFGITADSGFISDRVDLRITARLEVGGAAGAG